MATLALLLLALCSALGEGVSALRSRADSDAVRFDFTPFLIQYESGRVQRLMGTSVVPPSVDARTGVASADVVVDQDTGLAVRLYRPSNRGRHGRLPVLLYFHGGAFVVESNRGRHGRLPVLLYFHGGAFVVESAFGPVYHNYLNVLAARAGVIAVSVNYRLAPKHTLPAAYDDSWTALQWVLSNASRGSGSWLSKHGDMSRLFVGGDSAGGNIAHNLAMRAGQQGLNHDDDSKPRIKGVALLDPYFLGGHASPWAERAWGFICACLIWSGAG